MNDYRTEKTEIPEWMCQQEEYTPSKDKEAFLTKSTKSVLSVLGKLRFHEGKDGRFSATPSLKLFYTLIYIILTASASKLFICIDHVCSSNCQTGYFFRAAAIRQVLSETAGAVMYFCVSSFAGSFYGESSDTGEYYSQGVCIGNFGWNIVGWDILE